MNVRQGIVLAGGAIAAGLTWQLWPAAWQGRWTYHTPYSALYVDYRPPTLIGIALGTLMTILVVRTRR